MDPVTLSIAALGALGGASAASMAGGGGGGGSPAPAAATPAPPPAAAPAQSPTGAKPAKKPSTPSFLAGGGLLPGAGSWVTGASGAGGGKSLLGT